MTPPHNNGTPIPNQSRENRFACKFTKAKHLFEKKSACKLTAYEPTCFLENLFEPICLQHDRKLAKTIYKHVCEFVKQWPNTISKKNRCLHIGGSELAKRFFFKNPCLQTDHNGTTYRSQRWFYQQAGHRRAIISFKCVGLHIDRKKPTRLFELFVLLLREPHLTSSIRTVNTHSPGANCDSTNDWKNQHSSLTISGMWSLRLCGQSPLEP